MFGTVFKVGFGTFVVYRLGVLKLSILLILVIIAIALWCVYNYKQKQIPLQPDINKQEALVQETHGLLIATIVMGVISGLYLLYCCKILMDTPKAIAKEIILTSKKIGSAGKHTAITAAEMYRDVGNFFTDPIVNLYNGSVYDQPDGSWIDTRGRKRIHIEAPD